MVGDSDVSVATAAAGGKEAATPAAVAPTSAGAGGAAGAARAAGAGAAGAASAGGAVGNCCLHVEEDGYKLSLTKKDAV